MRNENLIALFKFCWRLIWPKIKLHYSAELVKYIFATIYIHSAKVIKKRLDRLFYGEFWKKVYIADTDIDLTFYLLCYRDLDNLVHINPNYSAMNTILT